MWGGWGRRRTILNYKGNYLKTEGEEIKFSDDLIFDLTDCSGNA